MIWFECSDVCALTVLVVVGDVMYGVYREEGGEGECCGMILRIDEERSLGLHEGCVWLMEGGI